jgi:predicted pyridoxine 5'-phosphate oxidase superfamily flavin-nucleotide-binding protein
MAVSLTEEQKDLLTQQTWVIGTASKAGKPNVAAKGMKTVLDGSTLVFGELVAGVTYRNIAENPTVTVAAFDSAKKVEIRCPGKAKMIDSGELYDNMAAAARSKGFPNPKAVIKVTLEEIRWWKP